jgi:acyl carrier protein
MKSGEMEEFYTKLADILEVDKVSGSDVLEDLPEWDSLSVLSVIAMIDSECGINLNARDLKQVSTAQNLYELIEQKRGG